MVNDFEEILSKFNHQITEMKEEYEKEAMEICLKLEEYDIMDILELFLTKQPELVNTQNEDGGTPLHIAAANNNLKLLKLLLQYGAEVESSDINGKTALHIAACNDSIACEEWLLTHHIQLLNTQDKDGHTPLHFAAANNDLQSLKLFLKYRADVKIRDNDGNRALQLTQDVECKKELMKKEE